MSNVIYYCVMFMKDLWVEGFKPSGSINLYNYDFTFDYTEDMLFLMMASALYKYLYVSNLVKPLFCIPIDAISKKVLYKKFQCCENAIMQFHGVQYLYNKKTLRKNFGTTFQLRPKICI